MTCCDNPVFLGCFNHCENIMLDLIALDTGTHHVVFRQFGVLNRQRFAAIQGAQFVIPNVFNENAEVTFQIYKPGNRLFTDKKMNTCFKIRITPQYAVDCEQGDWDEMLSCINC